MATTPSSAAGLLAVPRFRRLVVVAAVLGLSTVSDAFVYLVFTRRTGWRPTAFPLLFVGTALAYLCLAVPVGRLADRRGRAPVFMAGYVLLAGAYVVLRGAGPGLPTVVLLLGLLGAYYAATDGVLMAMASAVVPEDLRTSGLALLTTVTASARLVASLLFGLLWTWRGMEGALTYFLAGLVLAIALAGALLGKESQS
jgi:MFS family permease